MSNKSFKIHVFLTIVHTSNELLMFSGTDTETYRTSHWRLSVGLCTWITITHCESQQQSALSDPHLHNHLGDQCRHLHRAFVCNRRHDEPFVPHCNTNRRIHNRTLQNRGLIHTPESDRVVRCACATTERKQRRTTWDPTTQTQRRGKPSSKYSRHQRHRCMRSWCFWKSRIVFFAPLYNEP